MSERRFSEVSDYPGIEKEYAYTLQAMKNLKFDIWVASHASQFKMHKNPSRATGTILRFLWTKKGI